jgi:uncharacterized iron-regulated membrane protein
MRHTIVLIHRYIGLTMAGFLLVAGLTGSLLAWNDELEAAISPHLFFVTPPAPDARPIDPLALRERVVERYPNARVINVPLKVEPDRAIAFFMEGPTVPATGEPAELPDNQVFVDPYTGEVLGVRRWGDITQGLKNLMPFVYRLHYSLALGTAGIYLMGAVALLWTADCFAGVYLTLPLRRRMRPAEDRERKPWLARWWPAWKVRWQGGAYKLNFDLHRASGLWPCVMLLVSAWSAVGFNLPEVYRPVMSAVFTLQYGEDQLPELPRRQFEPGVSWANAREIGRELMAVEARTKGFRVMEEQELSYDPEKALYFYYVSSDRDIQHHWGATWVAFDANTGERRAAYLPTGEASGDTIGTWLMSLHMAAVFGMPMKLFVCGMGLAVAMLSVTGAVIWWRKRAARRAHGRRSGDGTTA